MSSRLVSALLMTGAVIFWIGAATPPYRWWMGPPLEELLTLIHENEARWTFIAACFAVAAVLTVPGMAALTALLRERGDRGWSVVGLALFVAGVPLWLVHLAYRVTVTTDVARMFTETRVVQAGFVAERQWLGLAFVGYMVLAYLAVAAYGAALTTTKVLPRVGRFAVVFGLVALPGLATPLFQPPLMVHVVPFAIGVALFRGRRLEADGADRNP